MSRVALVASMLGVSLIALLSFWLWHSLGSFGQNQNQTSTQNQVGSLQSPPWTTTSEKPTVLGVSEEVFLPTTLYGLLNGMRRDASTTPFTINPILEITAQRALNQPDENQEDISQLAKNLGFSGRSVIQISVQGEKSSWNLFTALSNNSRNQMLLQSAVFSEAGAAILCQDDQTPECHALILLGEK